MIDTFGARVQETIENVGGGRDLTAFLDQAM
jgi:hypothetical protein